MDIYPKINITAQLEFELTYFETTVHHAQLIILFKQVCIKISSFIKYLLF